MSHDSKPAPPPPEPVAGPAMPTGRIPTLPGDDLFRGLLASPFVPLCISTAGLFNATYLHASPAYLALVGRSWDEIAGVHLVGKGAAISNAARDRRLFLLDTAAGYVAEPADVRHASGRLVATLITAQRVRVGGEAIDIALFQPLPP